ncbi:MAG: hypothetical protein IPI52_09060 [Bacteroidetes bacterium]|nr:hypothetical protein [Bacteroidota bacterium]
MSPIVKSDISYEQLIQEINDYEGIIISTRTKIDKQLIDNASNLKFVGRVGSGMEHVDIDYCTKKAFAALVRPKGMPTC